MAISIDIYRQRIGTFVPRIRQKKLKCAPAAPNFIFKAKNSNKTSLSDILLSLSIWTVLAIAICSFLQVIPDEYSRDQAEVGI